MDKQLLADLTSPDEEIRFAAREELIAELDDEVAIDLLEFARGNADEEVRSEVLIALGPIIEEASDEYAEGDGYVDPAFAPPVSGPAFRKMIAALTAIYEDESQPKLVRRRAFEVLVRDPQPWQEDEIRKQFASGDEEWKITAVFGMGELPGFARELESLIQTAAAPLLFEAVRSAGKMEVGGVAERLRELASDEGTDRDTRLAAIEALPWTDPGCRDLLAGLAREQDAEIRAAAKAALDDLELAEQIEDDEDDDEEDVEDDEEQ